MNGWFCCVNFSQSQLDYSKLVLGSQRIELSCGRSILAIARNHQAFLDQVHQFNATQSATGRVEGFEAEHGPDDPFDGPVVLLNPIVQILALANLVLVAGFLLECLDSRGIGAALVDRDLVLQAVLAYGFPEKAQSGLLIAVSRQQKVDGLACFVDSTVEIAPLALDL
jgi:hypothetical protein